MRHWHFGSRGKEFLLENTCDIAQFFSFFNEILAKEKKIPGYKFNLRCFICDEGGYNYNAITQVYGEDSATCALKAASGTLRMM